MKNRKLTFTFGAIFAMFAILSTPAASFAQTTPEQTPAQIIATLLTPKPDAAKKDDAEGLFYFCDEVSEENVLSLTKSLESWSIDKDNEGKPVRIIMNSPGGSVFAGYALMDEIGHVRARNHHVKIVTYGMAASAAGWILQAGDERVIGANSWILIHQVSSQAQGKLAAIQADLRFTTQLQDQFLLALSQRSKLSLATIHEHVDQGQDWWISAKDALSYGLVDSIEPIPAFPTPSKK